MATFQERFDAGVLDIFEDTPTHIATSLARKRLTNLGIRIQDYRLKRGGNVQGSVVFRSEACGFTVERRFELRVQIPLANRAWTIFDLRIIRDETLKLIAEIFRQEDCLVRITTFLEDERDKELGAGPLFLEILLAEWGEVEAFLSLRLMEDLVDLGLTDWQDTGRVAREFTEALNPQSPPRCPECGADLEEDGTCSICNG